MLTVGCWDNRVFEYEPDKTALLVIDMQRDFFEDEDGSSMRLVIPKVASLLDAARKANVLVIHTRESYSPDLAEVSDYRHSLGYVGRPGPRGRYLVRGEQGCEFVDAVRPLASEPVIDKPGFSAFFRSDLEAVLQRANIERIMLCGVTTQCCVQSTLRDAVDRGYWCVTVADCCAANEQALHDASLLSIRGEGGLFGWICDLDNVSRSLSST